VSPLVQSSLNGGVHPGMKLLIAHAASQVMKDNQRRIGSSTWKPIEGMKWTRIQLECEVLNKVTSEKKLRWLVTKERKREMKKLSGQ